MENIIDKTRDSNIELLRIIMMFAIIAHHYVVNSGITEFYDFNNITGNMIFLEIFGFAGKAMINGFLLISGYFMVKYYITLKKVIKLYLQIKFYKIVIFVVFLIFGIQVFDLNDFIKTVFSVIDGVNVGFTATFFLLYLLMPFINLLCKKLSEKQYLMLLSIMFFYYTVIPTFYIFNDTFDELGWYIFVYLIGGYIRLYKDRFGISKGKLLLFNGIVLILIISSIIVIDYKFVSVINPLHFVSNANKLFAILLAICLFLLFKQMKISYNKVINKISSATFGVLLIHANSDAMRTFLWKDVFNVPSMYDSKMLIPHAVTTVLIIFAVCTAIEFIRIRFIEKPFFELLERNRLYKKCSNGFEKIIS